jgi:hypothetical protein
MDEAPELAPCNPQARRVAAVALVRLGGEDQGLEQVPHTVALGRPLPNVAVKTVAPRLEHRLNPEP